MNKAKKSREQTLSYKMEKFMNAKVVPILKVVSGNKYLRSLMEGFYVTLPIIIFSSIVGIVMWVPPAIKGDMAWYPLEVRQFLNRLYVLTMGLISIWFTMGIATSMAEKLNVDMPKGRKMNIMMVAFAAGSAILMMSVSGTFALNADGGATENFANILIGNLGSTGMLTSILVGLTLPWIFWLPVRFGWTIKLPKAVPQGVSQSFADIIPYGLSVMAYWGFGYIFIASMNITFTDALFALIQPLFVGLDSYGFLAAIAFLTAFIWFIGVHGPSVTRPFLTPFMYSNLADNQQLLAQGQHPHWALTYEFSYDFSASLGGTGATFVIPILFILFCKSKKLKAVGIASYIPIWFQVNEPALFGAPMILNPVFMLPFFILPMINIVIYKFFIDTIGMNGAIAAVPWSLPAVVGLLIGSGFDPLTVLCWFAMITIDFFLYIPFVLMHDKISCEEEIVESQSQNIATPLHFSYWNYFTYGIKAKFSKNEEFATHYGNMKSEVAEAKRITAEEKAETKRQYLEEIAISKAERAARKQAKIDNKNNKNTDAPVVEVKKITQLDDSQINVLVICYGAGTSAMLANTINKAALEAKITNIVVDSSASGAHLDKIKDANIVILSPQVKIYADEFRKQANPNAVVIETGGKEYIDATKEKDKALKLITDNVEETSLKYKE